MKITAEVSNLNKEEMNAYEADLKYRREEKQLEIAQSLKNAGVAITIIAQSTGLTIAEINDL